MKTTSTATAKPAATAGRSGEERKTGLQICATGRVAGPREQANAAAHEHGYQMDQLQVHEQISANDLSPTASAVFREIRQNHLVNLLLEGEMGAGKTTFMRALAREAGISANVNSPTFNLLNRYSETFYHYDLYRITETGAAEAGFFELWTAETENFELHAVEWPQKIPQLYSIAHTYLLKFEYSLDDNSDTRKLTLYRCRQ